MVTAGINWTKLCPVDGPMHSKVTFNEMFHHVILFYFCNILLKIGTITLFCDFYLRRDIFISYDLNL